MFKNVNSLIDNYYATLTYKAKFKALKSKYLTLTNQKLKKCEKSLNEMLSQLNRSNNFDKYRLYGDLLMANLYNLKDYIKEAKVFDYENNQGITILLSLIIYSMSQPVVLVARLCLLQTFRLTSFR